MRVITSIYTRKGHRYKCRSLPSLLLISVFRRAGLEFVGGLRVDAMGIFASAVNRLGIQTAAFFSLSQRALAKRFVYRASVSVSPQFSLFGWAP